MRALAVSYRHGQRQRIKQYLASVVLVAAASLLTLAVRPWFDGKSPLLFFTIAVLLAAGYGGVAQGLLATTLSLAVAFTFFREHVLVLVLANYGLTLFAVLGAAISVIMGRLRHANEALSQARDELKLANAKLAEHAEALSQSNAELERFAWAVAHDLNAPLRAISTKTSLCLEHSGSQIDRESKESLAAILRSAKTMSRLIENLLILAGIGHGKMEFGAEVEPGQVAERALQYLREEIDACGALIEIEALPSVRVNEDQLLRLFQNLLSNALKYRSEKPPHIRISAAAEGREWRFSISDNGIGIDPKYHAKVFEPFQRLHSASQYDGSGLGLAICKRIVEQHGGRMWVESAAGKGSRFCFTFPALAETQSSRKPAQATQARAIRKHAGA